MAGILEGIKVVEMGVLVAIPAATATMADWGADILKIEPLEGEMTRHVDALEDQDDPAAALPSNNWRFQVLNRGKRSMAIDLKTEAGRDIVYRILREADIFLTNYTPSSVSGLGMDYQTLIRINPKLVYGSLNGFGTKGPDRDLRGLDYTAAWARGGL
ncbi:MAG: CoA transferase, partial [Desulfobacterales bacterium]